MVRVFSLLNRMRKSSTGNPFFVRLWSVGRMRKKSANLRECVGLRPPPNSPIAFFQASGLGSGSSPPPPPSGSAGLEKMLANFLDQAFMCMCSDFLCQISVSGWMGGWDGCGKDRRR